MTHRNGVADGRDLGLDFGPRWRLLAERRLEHLTELFESGRWRRYYSERAFLEDIQAAKAAGMYTVGVANSHPAPRLWDASADEVVPSLVGYDVPALVRRLRQRIPA